jgi:shikimate kinase
MKSMTCKELGGACDLVFQAETFEEIAELSKKHGTEMFHKKDKDHLQAMSKMQELMQSAGGMQQWFQERKNAFALLPSD